MALVWLLGMASAALAGAPSHELPVSPRRPAAPPAPVHAPDRVLVRFKEGVPAAARAGAHAAASASVLRSFRTVENLHAVRLAPGRDVKAAIEAYRRNPNVRYAELDYRVSALVVPTDPRFGELWGLQNSGQVGGTPGADIDAAGAWAVTTGSPDVVVAMLDTGIDYTHPDLAANAFTNAADCDGDGADDDGNGVADDCHGIDTANDDADPMDDNAHGTHVAGTIGAAANNGIGVAGVSWEVGLLACKFLDASGSGLTSDAVACLDHVAVMKDGGMNIVATNNSWGGGGFSQSLADAIEAQRQRGILFIAAAGNDAQDNDLVPHYPASYDLPNVIAVAATTRTDGLASFSNVGRHSVHLGAPGHQILSTTPAGYASFSGTSMATPHVAGVAALLKAQNPSRDWRAIKNLILAGGDGIPALADTVTQRRLNAHGALTCSSSTVLARLWPRGPMATTPVGTPLALSSLHIDCENPGGPVAVGVSPGGETVTLVDDGTGPDHAAGDGIYSAEWTPSAPGSFALAFPDETVSVQALHPYTYSVPPFEWRTIAGTSLDLGDESAAWIAAPFPIRFGGASFSGLFAGSNGTLTFTGSLVDWLNDPLPTARASALVAPFWDDLYPVPGSAQNVFWAVVGSPPAREVVVEWRNIRHYSCRSQSSATVKFQVVFFEGRPDVLFAYADPDFGGACAFADRGRSATVGIQIGAAEATQWTFDTASLAPATALLWTPAPQSFTLSASVSGNGTVTSAPAGLACPGDCSASYAATSAVALVATAGPGSVFVGWSGDPDCADARVTMNADKTCTATFVLIGPDLVESSVSDPPLTALPGGRFSVTDTVLNQGSSPAAGTTTHYYFSLNPAWDSGDTRLTGSRPVPGLAAGAWSTGTVTVTVPASTAAGSYFLLVCADGTKQVVERDEGNNCRPSGTTVQVGRPDLLPTAVSNPPATVALGTGFAVTDTVKNDSAFAAGLSKNRYYLSLNGVWNSGDKLLTGSRSVPALAAGASSTGTVTVTVPASTAAGSYYLLVCADDTKQVVEGDEGNNCRPSGTMLQVGRPDLLPTAVSNPPATVALGTGFAVTDTVKNDSAFAAGLSKNRYYLSLNGAWNSGDKLLTGSRSVPALAAGASSTGTVTVTVPAGTAAGSYYLLVCADGTKQVAESDEGDNCRASGAKATVGP